MTIQSTTETATATASPHGPRDADGTLLELLDYLAQRRDRAARDAERHEYRLEHAPASDDKARRTCARWARLAREREQWYGQMHGLVAHHLNHRPGNREHLVGEIIRGLESFPEKELRSIASTLAGKSDDEAPQLRLVNDTPRKAVHA